MTMLTSRYNPYPEYKHSGVERMGEIPAHWQVKKVTRLFSIGSGTTPPTSNPEYYGGGIAWVTTSELRESVVTSTEKTISEEAVGSFPALDLYPVGSVAVAMYGATIGRLGILGIPATVNQACCVFSEPNGLDVWFWFYWLQCRRQYLISMSYGGGQPNLSQEILKSIRVPLPSLDEQRAIAGFLDRETAKIDSLVAKMERLIELLQEKRSALISRAVTKGLDPNVPMKDSGVEWLGEIPAHWEVQRLKRGAKLNPTASEVRHVPRTTEVSFVPMEAINQYGGLDLSQTKSLADVAEGYTFFRDGDVVIAKITPCFENWKGSITTGLANGVAFGTTELHVLRCSSQIDVHFMFYLTLVDSFRQLGESEMYGAGGQKRVPESFVSNFLHPLPPIVEQRAVAGFLDRETAKIDTLIAKVREAIDRLKELRTALISAAVTGTIDVREEVA